MKKRKSLKQQALETARAEWRTWPLKVVVHDQYGFGPTVVFFALSETTEVRWVTYGLHDPCIGSVHYRAPRRSAHDHVGLVEEAPDGWQDMAIAALEKLERSRLERVARETAEALALPMVLPPQWRRT